MVPVTRMVPAIQNDVQTVAVPVQSSETKYATIQVPRVAEEIQTHVAYQQHTVQEPVTTAIPSTVQVPVTQVMINPFLSPHHPDLG
jgi:hypothetical protein